MRFTIATAALAGSASAAAQYGYPVEAPQNTTSMVEYPTSTPVEVPVYVTETVSSIETYCPGPTEITHGTKTYTVTEATTLTITDCPCTVTHPVETPEVPVETPKVPVPTSEAPVVPVVPSEAPSVPAYPIPSNGTVPSAPAPYPTGTGAPSKPTSTGPAEFPGAASSLQVGSSLVIAIGALAAFL